MDNINNDYNDKIILTYNIIKLEHSIELSFTLLSTVEWKDNITKTNN